MDTFLGSLVQSCCGEGGTLQTNNTGVWSQCLGHTGFALTHDVCAFPIYTAQALDWSAGELSKGGPELHALSSLSCSGSGSRVFHQGTNLVGPLFGALPMSKQLR